MTLLVDGSMNSQDEEDVLAGRVDMFGGLSYVTVGEIWQTVWVHFQVWLILCVLAFFMGVLGNVAGTATETFGMSREWRAPPPWLSLVMGVGITAWWLRRQPGFGPNLTAKSWFGVILIFGACAVVGLNTPGWVAYPLCFAILLSGDGLRELAEKGRENYRKLHEHDSNNPPGWRNRYIR